VAGNKRYPGVKFEFGVGDRVVYHTVWAEGIVGLAENRSEFLDWYRTDGDPRWEEAAEHARKEILALKQAVGKEFTIVDHIYPGCNPYQFDFGVEGTVIRCSVPAVNLRAA
jgi:hypothetical protein